MRLMPYSFNVKYQAGINNSADYLSRSNPLPQKKQSHQIAEEYIHFIISNSLPIALSQKEVQDCTIMQMINCHNLNIILLTITFQIKVHFHDSCHFAMIF